MRSTCSAVRRSYAARRSARSPCQPGPVEVRRRRRRAGRCAASTRRAGRRGSPASSRPGARSARSKASWRSTGKMQVVVVGGVLAGPSRTPSATWSTVVHACEVAADHARRGEERGGGEDRDRRAMADDDERRRAAGPAAVAAGSRLARAASRDREPNGLEEEDERDDERERAQRHEPQVVPEVRTPARRTRATNGTAAAIWNAAKNRWVRSRARPAVRPEVEREHRGEQSATCSDDLAAARSVLPPKNGSVWYGIAWSTTNRWIASRRVADGGERADDARGSRGGSRASTSAASRAASRGARAARARRPTRPTCPTAGWKLTVSPSSASASGIRFERDREQRAEEADVRDGLGLERAEDPLAADQRLVARRARGSRPRPRATASSPSRLPIRMSSRPRTGQNTRRPIQPKAEIETDAGERREEVVEEPVLAERAGERPVAARGRSGRRPAGRAGGTAPR